MAIIPDIGANQSLENQMQMSVDVRAGCTLFNTVSPLGTGSLVVPNELMVQAVTLWLNAHPQEANVVIQALQKKQSADLDIIRTVQKSKI